MQGKFQCTNCEKVSVFDIPKTEKIVMVFCGDNKCQGFFLCEQSKNSIQEINKASYPTIIYGQPEKTE